LHRHAQVSTGNRSETSCQVPFVGLLSRQIEPGSFKHFAAQLKEGARTERFMRPQFFCLRRVPSTTDARRFEWLRSSRVGKAAREGLSFLHRRAQVSTGNRSETSCQVPFVGLLSRQIEPGSFKHFAAQLKEGVRTEKFMRPQFFAPTPAAAHPFRNPVPTLTVFFGC
jgi:hypothetical protein